MYDLKKENVHQNFVGGGKDGVSALALSAKDQVRARVRVRAAGCRYVWWHGRGRGACVRPPLLLLLLLLLLLPRPLSPSTAPARYPPTHTVPLNPLYSLLRTSISLRTVSVLLHPPNLTLTLLRFPPPLPWQYLATASGSDVHIHLVETRMRLATVRSADTSRKTRLAFHPTQPTTLAFASQSGTVSTVDAVTCATTALLAGLHTAPVTALGWHTTTTNSNSNADPVSVSSTLPPMALLSAGGARVCVIDPRARRVASVIATEAAATALATYPRLIWGGATDGGEQQQHGGMVMGYHHTDPNNASFVSSVDGGGSASHVSMSRMSMNSMDGSTAAWMDRMGMIGNGGKR